ncbi:hypothetical protein FNV43_RR13267 [Rhamnella rubrinervis]|uniref:Reticulon domain-containing protein n=1 Tax=Rhamnella rubrinervis TaxID=2594499 RepID=A0A8K0H0W5_9ROSA|nr:hypothetical protein FNV43_RR13267 [Rhamnella rubrinervis]
MPEKSTAENLFNNLVETIAESAGKHNAVSFLRKRKQTQSPPSSFVVWLPEACSLPLGWWKIWCFSRATAVWVLFEWLNYHLLSFIFFALVLGLLAQFVLKNASGLLNRSPSKDIACGGNLKQLLVIMWMPNRLGGILHVLLMTMLLVPLELFFKKTFSQMNTFPDMGFGKSSGYAELQTRIFLAQLSGFVIKSVASFLPETHHCTVDAVIAMFCGAHIAVLYEEYEDQIDSFVYKVLDHLQHNYKKLDAGVLSRIPKGKKVE